MAEHIPTLEEMIREYTANLNRAHQEKLEQLRNVLGQFEADGQRIGNQFGTLGGQAAGGQGTRPRWNSIEEMNRDLAAKRAREAALKPKPVDKPTRIKEIEQELDIIRGVVPTPKGYRIDKSKIRALIKELGELKA